MQSAQREQGLLTRDVHAAISDDIAEMQDVMHKIIHSSRTELFERRFMNEAGDRLAIRQCESCIVREHPVHRQLHCTLRQDRTLRV